MKEFRGCFIIIFPKDEDCFNEDNLDIVSGCENPNRLRSCAIACGNVCLPYVECTEEGRRFVSEDRKEGDVFDTLHLETRSQNTEKLSVSKAAAVLLNFLQQTKDEGDENGAQGYFQDMPAWKGDYF